MAVLASRNAVAMMRKQKPKNIVNPKVFDSPDYLRRISS
jgi:hypothetical protein